MAKVDPEKRRSMGAILSRSFTLSQPDLTAVEKTALACLKRIASDGREATQDEVRERVSGTGAGMATAIINRLVSKGYVEHVLGHPLQKGMWLRIVSTNQVTAQPKCTVPHWRTIKDRAPAPAIHTVRARDVSLAQWIEATSRSLSVDYLDFMMDLIRRGAQDFKAEEAAGEA